MREYFYFIDHEGQVSVQEACVVSECAVQCLAVGGGGSALFIELAKTCSKNWCEKHTHDEACIV